MVTSYHATSDIIYHRQMVTPDLLATLDMYRADAADHAEFYQGDEVALVRLTDLIGLAAAEVSRRARLANAGAGVRHPDTFEQWRLLAAAVREQLSLIDYCAHIGLELHQTGRDEWHGPCPVCRAGYDRLMVWPTRGRWHCRRCGGHGDVITLHRSITGAEFCEALMRLAEMAGLPLPAGVRR